MIDVDTTARRIREPAFDSDAFQIKNATWMNLEHSVQLIRVDDRRTGTVADNGDESGNVDVTGGGVIQVGVGCGQIIVPRGKLDHGLAAESVSFHDRGTA